MWECRCSRASVSAVTRTGEGKNLRSHVSLGFSCCGSDPSSSVLAAGGSGAAKPEGCTEGRSHVAWPGNVSCRAHCLLTETTSKVKLWKGFFVPLEEQTAWRRMSSISLGLFSYWSVCLLGGWRWLPFSHWEAWSFFPLLEQCPPYFPQPTGWPWIWRSAFFNESCPLVIMMIC